LEIDGSPVKGESSVVTQAVRAKKPGDEIELQWRAGNSMKAARIQLGARTEASTESIPKGGDDLSKKVKEQMDREEAGTRARDWQPSRKEPAPDGGAADPRFTPAPKRKFLKEAERQIKELAPEIEVDPYKRSGGEYRWKDVPLMDPPRLQQKHFLHSKEPVDVTKEVQRELEKNAKDDVEKRPFFSGPAARQLKEIAPELQVDPYKDPGMNSPIPLEVPAPSPERGKLQLKKPPLPKKEGKPADGPSLWKQEGKPAIDESLIWEKVRARVSRALENSGLEPGVKERVMHEIERARAEGAAQEARQARLEAEIRDLEQSARDLQQRAAELRREWKKRQE
jgi:hypothetical protein